MGGRGRLVWGAVGVGVVAVTLYKDYRWQATVETAQERHRAAAAYGLQLQRELEGRQARLQETEAELARALRREAVGVAAAMAREAEEEEREERTPLLAELRTPRSAREVVPFGFPSTANLKCHEGYVSAYDRRTRTAAWSCERISAATLRRAEDGGKAVARGRSSFAEDESEPPAFRALLSDYRGSGLDRGHLTPAADVKFSQRAMDETFLLSNVSPQVGKGFNRDYWARLEQFSRSLVHAGAEEGPLREVFVCSGPLYLPERGDDGRAYVRYRMIPDEEPRVAVPTHFYKAIAVRTPGAEEVAVAAFVLPNRPLPDDVPLEQFAVSLDELEAKSGLEFFQELPPCRRVPLSVVAPLQLPAPDWWKGKEKSKSALDAGQLAGQLDAFEAGAEVRLAFPASLSPRERALVHKAAEARGLRHESEGYGDKRHVVVSKRSKEKLD